MIKVSRRIVFWLLRRLGGAGFANELFSPRLLLWHLFWQKFLRVNSEVPWPVHMSSRVTHPANIEKGTRCPGMSPGCYIQGKNGIVFGRNVWLGPGVGIVSAKHDLADYQVHVPAPPIRIGDDCWIGMNAVVLPGVQLGAHVIVAAGAIVTHDFPSNCVIAGNPARVIQELGPYLGKKEVRDTGPSDG